MELWIRSQDKESLTKVSNISLKEIRKPYTNEFGYYGIGTYYDNLQVLGKYATKERALEVLDEIQNALLTNDRYDYTNPPTLSNITGNLIFEMPKD